MCGCAFKFSDRIDNIILYHCCDLLICLVDAWVHVSRLLNISQRSLLDIKYKIWMSNEI